MKSLSQDLMSAVVRRLRIIPVENPSLNSDGLFQFGFCASLADLGYEVVNADDFDDAIMHDWGVIGQTLREMKVAHVDHVPLFPDFPNMQVSGLNERFWANRFIPWMVSLMPSAKRIEIWGWDTAPAWMASVPNWVASSVPQDPDAFFAGRATQAQRPGDDIGNLHPVEIVTGTDAIRAAIEQYVRDVLYAGSSVKEAIRPDFELMLNFVGVGCIDPSKISYKENLAYLMKFFWEREDYSSFKEVVRSPTDILRMFAALTGGDVSLAEKIKFPRLRKPQRRAVLGAIAECPYMIPDLFRHRDLWLAVGKSIHVGEYKGKFPLVAVAFDELRNGKFQSWEGRIDALTTKGDVQGLLRELSKRPGEFARRLHWAVRTIGDQAIDAFVEIADRVPIKTLVVLERYFETVDFKETRAFYTKTGRLKVLPNKLTPIRDDQRERLNAVIQSAVQTRIAGEKESWADRKVWIDPALAKYVAPLSQRKASDAFLSAGKGSRIPVDASKTVRMFCYWKQPGHTDLDISALMLDESLNSVGQVSYTNLRDNSLSIVHSGDLTSAPLGAVEYIDINVPKLRREKGANCRYVAIQVYKYAGADFADCEECYVGWMSRSQPNGDRKSFDPKTVENAFVLQGKSKFAFPIMIDLQTAEIVYIDLYSGSPRWFGGYNVHNQKGSVIQKAAEALAMVETRPNMLDLSKHHVLGRGATLVENAEEADFRIGIRGCDLNAENIEETLAELL